MAITSPSPHGLIAIAVVFWVVQATSIVARFSVPRDKHRYGIDDFTALLASVAYTAIFTVPVIIGASTARLGEHYQVTANGMPIFPSTTFNKVQFIFITFHMIVLGLARCSILLLYRRIFRGRTFNIVVWTMIVYTVIWTMGFFFTALFRCSPITTNTIPPPHVHCPINLVLWTKALGITSALSDLVLLLIPIPLVYQLQMSATQKFAVIFVFLLGNLTLAASITRCIVLFQIDKFIAEGIPDFTYFDGVNIVWAMLESAIAITCSCLPLFGRLITRKVPEAFSAAVSRAKLIYSQLHSDESWGSFPTSKNGSISKEGSASTSEEKSITIRHEVEVVSSASRS